MWTIKMQFSQHQPKLFVQSSVENNETSKVFFFLVKVSSGHIESILGNTRQSTGTFSAQRLDNV